MDLLKRKAQPHLSSHEWHQAMYYDVTNQKLIFTGIR